MVEHRTSMELIQKYHITGLMSPYLSIIDFPLLASAEPKTTSDANLFLEVGVRGI